jgi:hypothetical protein
MSKFSIIFGVLFLSQQIFAQNIYSSLNQSLQKFEGKTGRLSTNLPPDQTGEIPANCSIRKLFSKKDSYNSYVGTSVDLGDFSLSELFASKFVVESNEHLSEQKQSGEKVIYYNNANKPNYNVTAVNCGSNGWSRPFNGVKQPRHRVNSLIISEDAVEVRTEYSCGLLFPESHTISWACQF